MRVIIPLAGFGKRMRPHTWSKPKPLLNVAGKPILGHVLDKFEPLGPEQFVFIIGWLGEQIQEYVSDNYDVDAQYVVQEELLGQAHAIYLAREHLSGPCIIVFVDTLFEADLSPLKETRADGVMYVQEVEDPRRFGVVVEEGQRIVKIIEKPDTFEHRKAVIGLYYVKEGRELVDAIETLLTQGMKTKGEFYLADAFQIMIDRGARFVSKQVSVWEDCGKPETVLHTNRYLLEHGHTHEISTESGLLIPPVHIADTAIIHNAVVGPHVTIGAHAEVRDAIVRDAIIEEGSLVQDIVLAHSLVGRNATVKGSAGRYNVGDNTMIDLGGESPLLRESGK